MSAVDGMAAAAGSAATNELDRMALLREVPTFTMLGDSVTAELAEMLVEERYAPGATVFSEGDHGDRVLMVAEGLAELSARGSVGAVPLATLDRGEIVGSVSLIASAAARRNATLTALTPLVVLALGAEPFHEMLGAHPELRRAFEAHAEEISTARLVKQVGPFMSLDDPTRRWLAKRLVRREFARGEVLMREGEQGSSCFLLRSGSVEIAVGDGDRVRVVAHGAAGSVVGEAALLTDTARSATVRATEPCVALELRRADLDAVVASSPGAGRELIRLFRQQERPVRDPLVQVAERQTPEGDTITTLKHPSQLTYYRLSGRGRFIWELLDGNHDLRALTLAVLGRYGEFAPQAIADILAGLKRTRMVVTRTLRRDLETQAVARSRLDQILSAARRGLELELSVKDLDRHLTAAYDGGVRWLFTRPAQALLALVAGLGLIAFGLQAAAIHRALGHQHALLVWVIPGLFVTIAVHELGHAFTVKALGRSVNRGGVGWYWFAPVAFVDTSDMWLGTRRERILVSCAGPYANLILGGCLTIASLTVSDAGLAAVLWTLAIPNYLQLLFNLNPLLEFDGYHVLSDLLDRPGLRAEALEWLGSGFPSARHDRQELLRHRVDLAFGLASIVYVAVSIVAMLLLYRITVQSLIASAAPHWLARGLAWLLALAIGIAAVLGTLSDLRGSRRAA
jgi:CRP-like cAMP-binding protein/Zn-dependent protease